MDEIHDIHGLRLIVETEEDCYKALRVVQNLWHEVPKRFKDYIIHPKFNRYQSLHTVVSNVNMVPFEDHIQTKEMHLQAEYIFPAHWRYKGDFFCDQTRNNLHCGLLSRMFLALPQLGLASRGTPTLYSEIESSESSLASSGDKIGLANARKLYEFALPTYDQDAILWRDYHSMEEILDGPGFARGDSMSKSSRIGPPGAL